MKQSRLWGIVCACLFSLISLQAHAAAVSGQGTWETTLQGRDLDGNSATFEAYYDTVLDISWLADAYYSGISMDRASSISWATDLDIHGISGWRLPSNSPIDGVNYNYTQQFDGASDIGYNIGVTGTPFAGTTASEMAHMFHVTLGNTGRYNTAGGFNGFGWGLRNTGPFTNLLDTYYWSASDNPSNPSKGWYFHFNHGAQNNQFTTYRFLSWAVHDGDVGTAVVPVPAALWLFASGLLGLIGTARAGRSLKAYR